MPNRRDENIRNNLDSLLHEVLRAEARTPPITEDQVEAAERLLDASGVTLPARLMQPPSLSKLAHKQLGSRIATDYWTHHSVLTLGANVDPIGVITERARSLVMNALEQGWNGPPYDPFDLADLLKIRVVPNREVVDARITANSAGTFTIAFNPERAAPRIRYSIAHEIAHTLFSDCAQMVRHRGAHAEMPANGWQLEMLCNIAASEILMPFGSLSQEDTERISVETVWDLRKKYRVSSEAVLLRLTRLTKQPRLAFAARRPDNEATYYVDYSMASRSWSIFLPSGLALPRAAAAHECTAIGFTARANEHWVPSLSTCYVEYLGIPAYKTNTFPRVLGLLAPSHSISVASEGIREVRGDARKPRGMGQRLIVQLVNDKARTWGAGFAKAVRQKWPELQTRYSAWVDSRDPEFKLGGVHFGEIEPTLHLASIVAQHGYGPSPKPRIRYGALVEALEKVASFAKRIGATIHMPKIGAGESRGNWSFVRDIVDDVLCANGLEVTVYELPEAKGPVARQEALNFK
jgi:hypothetical protein